MDPDHNFQRLKGFGPTQFLAQTKENIFYDPD